jgi:hypothetical protein
MQNNNQRIHLPRIIIPPQQQILRSEADLSLDFNILLGNDLSNEYNLRLRLLFLENRNNRILIRNETRNLQILFANRSLNPRLALDISQQHYDAVVRRDNAEQNNN